MSYDISITALRETTIFDTNYTYNVSPMFVKALGEGGINQLHGKKCNDCLSKLHWGIKHMEENPKEYESMNPENKWGNFAGALKVLQDLLQHCKDNRDGTVHID